MFETLSGLAPILIPVLGAIAGAIGGIKFVREGERAIMLRFEKAVKRKGTYKVIYPGLTLMIPKVHHLARTHVRQRTINLPSQTIVLTDSTVFSVSAVILCRVKDTPEDLYRVLFETTGVNQALEDYGLVVIREVLADKVYSDLIENREQISEQLFKAITVQADGWGIEIIKFELSDCEPTQSTAALMQVSANAVFRIKALTKAAAELGLSGPQAVPAGLAAILVGAPLVASTNVSNSDTFVEEVES